MVKRSSEYYPLLDLQPKLAPRLRELLERDKLVIESVDVLLSTPSVDVTRAIEATRLLIMQRDGRECDDTRLATEIDHVSSFICNEALYYQQEQTSRYARSQL